MVPETTPAEHTSVLVEMVTTPPSALKNRVQVLIDPPPVMLNCKVMFEENQFHWYRQSGVVPDFEPPLNT